MRSDTFKCHKVFRRSAHFRRLVFWVRGGAIVARQRRRSALPDGPAHAARRAFTRPRGVGAGRRVRAGARSVRPGGYAIDRVSASAKAAPVSQRFEREWCRWPALSSTPCPRDCEVLELPGLDAAAARRTAHWPRVRPGARALFGCRSAAPHSDPMCHICPTRATLSTSTGRPNGCGAGGAFV